MQAFISGNWLDSQIPFSCSPKGLLKDLPYSAFKSLSYPHAFCICHLFPHQFLILSIWFLTGLANPSLVSPSCYFKVSPLTGYVPISPMWKPCCWVGLMHFETGSMQTKFKASLFWGFHNISKTYYCHLRAKIKTMGLVVFIWISSSCLLALLYLKYCEARWILTFPLQ